MENIELKNIAETLASEMKSPVEIIHPHHNSIVRIALPQGWALVEKNDEAMLDRPLRKKALVKLTDADSFIDYVTRHGDLQECTIWCEANYKAGKVAFIGILNDHSPSTYPPAWRDHRAKFTPDFSEEWQRWFGNTKTAFSQTDFAVFIEDNIKDIRSVDGSPTGAQMLDMALTFEANQDLRFKSAIRLQSGGVSMSFTQDDDKQTVQKMQVFDRFTLGFPVFWNSEAYQVDARLRYRVREGKLTFWYELIRADKVLEAATKTLIEYIRGKTGNAFFFGDPFSKD
jgi:uncharacterized protein YfdQ (DUF2303 family)